MPASLFLVIFVVANGTPDASRKAAEAYASQQHIGEHLDSYYRNNFSEEDRQKLALIANLAQVAAERRITFSWTY